MNQQRGEDVVSDAAAKVENTVSDLGAKAEKTIQDKIDQGKPVLRDLQESAAAAIDKTADLARKVPEFRR
jgi:F0F1-type ATP synthase membrane subunit b/b'